MDDVLESITNDCDEYTGNEELGWWPRYVAIGQTTDDEQAGAQ